MLNFPLHFIKTFTFPSSPIFSQQFTLHNYFPEHAKSFTLARIRSPLQIKCIYSHLFDAAPECVFVAGMSSGHTIHTADQQQRKESFCRKVFKLNSIRIQ